MPNEYTVRMVAEYHVNARDLPMQMTVDYCPSVDQAIDMARNLPLCWQNIKISQWIGGAWRTRHYDRQLDGGLVTDGALR